MPTHYEGTEEETRALNAFIRFTRAFQTVDRKISTTFQAHDLTSGQFGVLESLYHLGPMHQGTLGDKLLQSKGNISTIISNLEDREFVERRRDPDDRRYVTVHLTDEGEGLIADIFPDHVQRIAKTLGVLDNEEIEELGRLCKKLGVRNADG
jgi:MarR family 2-MHQ and catechol resistance regulon transcriptional repressor